MSFERPSDEPKTPEEWENEVLYTKVRDRLVLLKNRSFTKFNEAIAGLDTSDAFLRTGDFTLFVLQGSAEAREFVQRLGVSYEALVSEDDVDREQFM